MSTHDSSPPPSQPPVTWRRPPAGLVPPKPPYRPGKSDGILIGWSVLCGVWWLVVIAANVFAPGDVDGAALAIQGFVVFVVWAVPAFWLTIIYLVARAGRRRCTVCGDHVPSGLTQCRSCGFDFAAAARR